MRQEPTGSPDRSRYSISIKGHLDSRWTAWFDGMALTTKSDGTTVIEGPVADQAALYGVLRKLRDVGLPLISVSQIETDQPAFSTANPDNSHLGD